jgi:(p)ppGpp synthase/HD superfamily hydrolase
MPTRCIHLNQAMAAEMRARAESRGSRDDSLLATVPSVREDLRPSFIDELPLARAASAWAAALHAGQVRPDGSPYVLHVVEVGALLDAYGFPEWVVVAGLLHDAVERSAATAADVAARFGSHVADIVTVVTDDERIADESARKAALRGAIAAAPDEAVAVYAANKVAAARELRARVTAGPWQPDDRRRVDHYRASLEVLQHRAPTLRLVRQLRFELWALNVLPSRDS